MQPRWEEAFRQGASEERAAGEEGARGRGLAQPRPREVGRQAEAFGGPRVSIGTVEVVVLAPPAAGREAGLEPRPAAAASSPGPAAGGSLASRLYLRSL